jgi:hypothetical protein
MRTFVLDFIVTPESGRDALIETEGAALVQCFVEALPLIPRQHLELLRHLQGLKWPKSALTDLVLCRFLWPSTIGWVAGSPHSEKVELIEEVIVRIGEQKRLIAKLWKAIDCATAVVEVPVLFQVMAQFQLLYFLCVNDVAILARILDDQHLLPRSTDYAEFVMSDKGHQFNWIWCQVFPKSDQRVPDPPVNVIFDSSVMTSDFAEGVDDWKMRAEVAKLIDRAKAFEDLLLIKWHCQLFREWESTIHTRVDQLMANAIDYFVVNPHVRVSHATAQLIRLCAIDQDAITARSRELSEFADRWDTLMEHYRDGRELRRLLSAHVSAYNGTWQSIRRVRCLAGVPFERRFRPLVTALVHFRAVAEVLGLGVELLCNIIAQLPGDAVLVPFMVYGGIVARDQSLLADPERHAWLAFETCLLQMLKEDPVFMCTVVSVRGDLG